MKYLQYYVSQITTAYLQLICSISELKDVSQIYATHHQTTRRISNCYGVSPINMQYLRLIDVSQIYATHHQPT